MTRDGLYAFLRRFRYGVFSSVGADGAPQSALVGYAATPELELVFDTLRSSRKFANVQRGARCSFVIGGWDSEQTLQIEGDAFVPSGAELEQLQRAYFAIFPDGVERAKSTDIAYIVVRPKWIRYSDYDLRPPEIQEWRF